MSDDAMVDGSALCDFCYAERNEADIGMTPEYQQSCMGLASTSRVVWSSDVIAVIVALGPLVPTNLLVVPRRAHYLSFRDMPLDDLHDAVVAVDTMIGRAPSTRSERWMLFEHGMTASHESGGCVEHAHLQMLRVGPQCDVLAELDDAFGTGRRRITNLDELRSLDGEYLYVTSPGMDVQVAYSASQLPGQFLRRLLGHRLGMTDEWNWRKFPRCDAMQSTIQMFGVNPT